MKRILCYGDSNTWGCIPGVYARYPEAVRWTGIMAKQLGDGYWIHEDGINGRSTVWNDPENPCRNGLAGIGYALYRSKPLDLVIVMLGTNDLNYTDANGYENGLCVLTEQILSAQRIFPGTSDVFSDNPRLLLISPIRTTPQMPQYEQSCLLSQSTQRVARRFGVPWMDAAKFAQASTADGYHMDADNHRLLGVEIAKRIKTIL